MPRSNIPLHLSLDTNGINQGADRQQAFQNVAQQDNEDNADEVADNVGQLVNEGDQQQQNQADQNDAQQGNEDAANEDSDNDGQFANEGDHQQQNQADRNDAQQGNEDVADEDAGNIHQAANHELSSLANRSVNISVNANILADNVSHSIRHGHRNRRRIRGQYDRNVQINRDFQIEPTSEMDSNQPIRRSNRIPKAVKRFNIGEIACFVCKKKFRAQKENIPLEDFDQYIACSFECIRKA